MAEERWVYVAAAEELPPGGRKLWREAGHHVWVVNLGNAWVAFEAVCPHQEFLLDTADIRDEVITCPFHGYQYCLRTGKNLYPASAYPPGCEHLKAFLRPLQQYPVRIRADGVWVALPAEE